MLCAYFAIIFICVLEVTSYNSTIGKNSIYYSAGALGGQQHTWWQQTIDALGMRLLVNNSWSGSAVLKPRQGAGSEGYLSRCVNLHNDKTGETPNQFRKKRILQ